MVDVLGKDRRLLPMTFFQRPALTVAQDLIGKVLIHQTPEGPLACRIIETEAYLLTDKASHSSLGYTEKRKALFMPPGTIYMYYAHGGDSLNFSCLGKGNAVLIKSAYPLLNPATPAARERMLRNNPLPNGQHRKWERLCAGQTLLCRTLDLKVPILNARSLSQTRLELAADGYHPDRLIQTSRLGIPKHRDADLPYRFVDHLLAAASTKNPLRVRTWQEGEHYTILDP